MCNCHPTSCHGCGHSLNRRCFLQGLGAGATIAGMAASAIAAGEQRKKPRVAAVFLQAMDTIEIWPYPNFDTKGRQTQIMAALTKGCPDVEFVPVTVESTADVSKALDLKDKVDGYLVYVMTLVWSQGPAVVRIARLGKPTLVVDEFLGGSGVFLTRYGEIRSRKIPAAAVSSTRIEDLVTVAAQFAHVGRPGATPESFARRCEEVYHKTFPARSDGKCIEDNVPLTEISDCVKRFRQSKFLVVGRGKPGEEQDFLGAKARYIDFKELQSFYDKVDRDEAAHWGRCWSNNATKVMEPQAEPIRKAGGVYLAILELLKKYGTDNITMNCLGGFRQGNLPAYPCLGFMQLLDDGKQGVCEAMPDDTLSMMMARILTGRPGFVSDPALDTSKNHIVYAHCVGNTRPFGPQGEPNGYRIRTLHNRDPRGCCSESLLPAGYMTTTFRTNAARKELIIHQAKSVGTLDSEYGCRTKLIGEVTGDIGKLFDQWDKFSWHRVTVYGDVQEPLIEFGKALGLKIIQEA
ncbi:MAG: hypothetical protein JXM70_17030 [Pirellulales bacterium]|nr:hypothetical protein [Pirellulales bacterium]